MELVIINKVRKQLGVDRYYAEIIVDTYFLRYSCSLFWEEYIPRCVQVHKKGTERTKEEKEWLKKVIDEDDYELYSEDGVELYIGGVL